MQLFKYYQQLLNTYILKYFEKYNHLLIIQYLVLLRYISRNIYSAVAGLRWPNKTILDCAGCRLS